MVTKKILIIEDDRALAKTLTQALDAKRYTISIALDSQEGVTKAVRSRPDVILLDILLPGANGFETLRVLRGRPATRDIPVLILSNIGMDDERALSKRLGATEYLVKADVSVNQIVAAIERAVGD